jgi:hypothetical protein
LLKGLLLLLMLLLLLLHLLLMQLLLLVILGMWLLLLLLLLSMVLRLSCWEPSKAGEVGMHHSLNKLVPRVLRCLMAASMSSWIPAVTPWLPSQGGSRHGMLMEGSTGGG